jgi:hypothetical protein
LKSFSYPRLVSFIWARDSHHNMPHVSFFVFNYIGWF